MICFSVLDCKCDVDGSLEDSHCDATNGTCHCKCNIRGDKCDTCAVGYYSFPDCHGNK